MKSLQNNCTYIEYGPVSAVVSVLKNGKHLKDIEIFSFEIVKDLLLELTTFKEILKLKAFKIKIKESIPEVVKKCIVSAKLVNEKELTPISAVAGSVADCVVKKIKEISDYDRIIFNNGGDISIECSKTELLPIIDVSGIKGKLISTEIKGIATSGLGGRSFTKGIAESVTVFAENSSIADASATFIANNVIINSGKVKYAHAHEIFEDTDLKGEEVVLSVDELDKDEIIEALENGLKCAEELKKDGKIYGAILKIKDYVFYTKDLLKIFRRC